MDILSERYYISHLMDFLMRCELIAMRCAANQSKLAKSKPMSKFFSVQARQEKHHALIFQQAYSWMRPKGFNKQEFSSLEFFEDKLQGSLSKNNLAESIIAQQLLFEGLGEITLEKLSMAADKRGLGFQRIRNIILKQEHAHHAYGEKYIDDVLTAQDLDLDSVSVKCQEYLDLLYAVLHEMNFVLEYYGHSCDGFYQNLFNQLPCDLKVTL